jgi:hypothetical protein
MLREIEEYYIAETKEGREVYSIEMSPIAYDHLQSELKNRRATPEWTGLIRIKENTRRFTIHSQPLALAT